MAGVGVCVKGLVKNIFHESGNSAGLLIVELAQIVEDFGEVV